MNEPPGARARVALTGLTVAEYFRDQEGQDVLLFIDNIFRFTQAGSEVGAGAQAARGGGGQAQPCSGAEPLVVGTTRALSSSFPPPGVSPAGENPLRCGLPAHAGHRHGHHAGADHHHAQGLHHLGAGSAGAAYTGWGSPPPAPNSLPPPPLPPQAIYVPADDLTDPAPATTFAHLDATTVLSRAIAELGIYPAVDPLDSTSRIMDPNIVGPEHYDVARGVQKILQVRGTTGQPPQGEGGWEGGWGGAGSPALVAHHPALPRPPGLQVPAGHHRHPGHGRAVGGGQADGGAGAQDPALLVAALPGGRGLHRPHGQAGAAEGDHQGLQADPGR